MYSLVIYGATGFTGKLATSYVANQYKGVSWKWAIAGRSREKLESLRQSVGADCDVLVADGADEVAIADMVKKTKVVVTFAGPFCRYGSKLVAACAEHGVGYCDITGELPWVRDMIALHDAKARQTGARIVHACGHDSVPWDLMTMKLAQKLKELGASELQGVDLWDQYGVGSFSGGTLETMFEMMTNRRPELPEVKALGYDPLLKSATGPEKSTYEVKDQLVKFVDFPSDAPPRCFFVMSPANLEVVSRSNALLGYGNTMSYREGMQTTSKVGALGTMLGLIAFGILLVLPPTRYLLRRFALPKPGEGPSEETMKKGFLNLTGVGKSVDGKVAKARLTFPVDPGYLDTARMAIESGLAISLEGDKLAAKGGVLTPASCQGDVLLQRLVATGSTFEFIDADAA